MATRRSKAPGGFIVAGILALLLIANGTAPNTGQTPTTTLPPRTTTIAPTTVAPTTTAAPTTVAPTTTGTTTTLPPGTFPAAYTEGGRWFSPNASWNRPVSEFGYAASGSQLEAFGNVFWRCAGWSAETRFPEDCLTYDRAAYAAKYPDKVPTGINISFKDYSIPTYRYSSRSIYTGTEPLGSWANPCGGGAKVYQLTAYKSLYGISDGSMNTGDCIPWNEDWRPGTGNDQLAAVVDAGTGTVWGYAGISPRSDFGNDDNTIRTHALLNCTEFFGNGENVAKGFHSHIYPYYFMRTELCGYGFSKSPHPGSNAGDLFTAGDTAGDTPTATQRGSGINKQALITRAIEVDQGVIRHALELSIPSTMFADDESCPKPGVVGPCPTHYCAEVTNPEYPGAGDTCAIMLPPASRVEFSSGTNTRLGDGVQLMPATNYHRQRTVPEGIRISLDPSVDIEAWLNTRGFTGKKKDTARIFAVALRDYGAIVAETGGNGITIETDGIIDTTPGGSRDVWARNGITDTGGGYPHGDLLAGLLTPERLRVVNPPPRDPKLPTYP